MEIEEIKQLIEEMCDIMPFELNERIKPYIVELVNVSNKPLQSQIEMLETENEFILSMITYKNIVKLNKENTQLKEKLKEVEEEAQMYGEFCIRLDREKKSPLIFKDFQKLV